MNETQEKIAPVVKNVQVGLPPEEAFRLFTAGIASWWPLASHSVGEEQARSCTLEGQVGGRIYETLTDGRQEDWGRVTIWEPPQRVAFTWHPGGDPQIATQVEVTFREVEEGTQVELTHRGWEVLGERSARVRENYVSGWDVVLGNYTTKARD
jgi:uncharacterized protein YndB with AHSA1/START domain